jgi:hypothetical protein
MPRRRRVVATVFVATVLGFSIADWFTDAITNEWNRHQVFTTVCTELIFLAGTYFIVDYVISEVENRRWRAVATEPLHAAGRFCRFLYVELPAEETRMMRFPRKVREDFRSWLDVNGPLLTSTPELAECWRSAFDLDSRLDRIWNADRLDELARSMSRSRALYVDVATAALDLDRAIRQVMPSAVSAEEHLVQRATFERWLMDEREALEGAGDQFDDVHAPYL